MIDREARVQPYHSNESKPFRQRLHRMAALQAPCRSDSTVALVHAAQHGSPAALEELVERYYVRIYAYLLQLTSSPQLAEDLTQEAFIQVFERIGQLIDVSVFDAWLFQIARNQWRMHVRQEHRAQLRQDRHAPCTLNNQGASSMLDAFSERQLAEEALGCLAADAREALLLRHVWGFTDQEIGLVLHISRAAAQKRAYRAEQEFRKHYLLKAQWDGWYTDDGVANST